MEPMTASRTEVLAAGRAVLVRMGACPHCLSYLAEWPDSPYVHCPRCLDAVYEPTTGEVQGKMT